MVSYAGLLVKVMVILTMTLDPSVVYRVTRSPNKSGITLKSRSLSWILNLAPLSRKWESMLNSYFSFSTMYGVNAFVTALTLRLRTRHCFNRASLSRFYLIQLKTLPRSSQNVPEPRRAALAEHRARSGEKNSASPLLFPLWYCEENTAHRTDIKTRLFTFVFPNFADLCKQKSVQKLPMMKKLFKIRFFCPVWGYSVVAAWAITQALSLYSVIQCGWQEYVCA